MSVADATALGLSTPEIPNHTDAKSSVPFGGGKETGGLMHIFRASETAPLTAGVNASTPTYAKLDGPLSARPIILPEAEQITAEVLDPPQSTQR